MVSIQILYYDGYFQLEKVDHTITKNKQTKMTFPFPSHFYFELKISYEFINNLSEYFRFMS